MRKSSKERILERRKIIEDGISECRGRYLNHAISVERNLNELLTELFLPPNSLGKSKIVFQDHILGTRGLSFSSKIDVMLGGMLERGVAKSELTKFAQGLRRLGDFRNALAHAAFDRISHTDRAQSGGELTAKNVTFHLTVYSASGLPKPTPVSLPIVEKRIKSEQPLVDQIREYWHQILESEI